MNNDIKRQSMKDVIVPQNDIIRRAPLVPEAPVREAPSTRRIDSNPFFEKGSRAKKSEQKLEQKSVPTSRRNGGSGAKGALFALLFTVLLALVFVVLNYFATAVVEITPITHNADINATITTPKEAGVGELIFNTATISEEQTKEVPATMKKDVQVKASGKVVIFNEYSKDSQRLIKNTRLESSTGKIFRIDQSVVVPGMKGNVPGSVEVLVYADAPGKEYNIGIEQDKFTIPGFKGDPRYTKFYGKQKENAPIAGGFKGEVKVPSEVDILAAREELKQELKKIVVEKLRSQIPQDSSFFPGSMIVKFEEVPLAFSADDVSKVSERAIATVFFFNTKMLTEKLAELSLPDDFKGKSLSILDTTPLTFAFVDPVENIVLSDITKLKFTMSGSVVFVGDIDTEKIRTELAGKKKKDFATIITEKDNVYKANAIVRPMWKSLFPEDPSKITFKIITK